MSGQVSSILDKLIAVTIILLILSIINEKITNLIRLIPVEARRVLKGIKNVFRKKENRKSWQPEVDIKKREEQKTTDVTILSFFVGIGIAFVAKADLWEMFGNNDSSLNLFNESTDLSFWGVLFVALFTCLGSKFLHDLLEILLQVKNLKRKLHDKELYKVETIEAFDEYLKLTEGEIVRLAIEENKEYLMGLDNVVGFAIGATEKDGKRVLCADIQISDENREKIKNYLYLTLPSGRPLKIPVVLKVNAKIPTIQYAPGDKIANSINEAYKGSFGCILKDKLSDNKYILTCSHVLNEGRSDNLGGRLPKDERVGVTLLPQGSNKSVMIGNWYYAKRNNWLDVALVSIDDPSAKNTINNIKLFNSCKVSAPNLLKEIEICLNGAVSGERTGKIVSLEWSGPIKYDDGKTIDMNGLIKLKSKDNKILTKKGDSGTVFYNQKTKEVLGMIIAGDDDFSYAIPMDYILDDLYMRIA